jgi:hypothetical protein
MSQIAGIPVVPLIATGSAVSAENSFEDLLLGETFMTISMYQALIPSIIRSLNNLMVILEKGAAHAEARKIDPSILINSRLYPDMLCR